MTPSDQVPLLILLFAISILLVVMIIDDYNRAPLPPPTDDFLALGEIIHDIIRDYDQEPEDADIDTHQRV